MLPKLRVLFVDDEPHVLSALTRHLRRDFEVVTACGPEEGLEALNNKGPFSVVVADMQMPGMDGISFLNLVREIQPTAIRMILTGNADQDTKRRAEGDIGINRLLFKPCSPESLLAAILEAVDAKAA